MKHIEVIGDKYGKLTVLEEVNKSFGGRKRYLLKCRCDCGNYTVAEKSKVRAGATTSCGCVQAETRKNLGSLNKKPTGVSAFNEVYGAYVKGAKIRGYSFELTKEEFAEIIVKPCIYCGDEGTQLRTRKSENGSFRYTGIDRYDNTKGYTKDNCVPCCKVCNRIKTDMSIEDMETQLEKIMSRKNIWKRTA